MRERAEAYRPHMSHLRCVLRRPGGASCLRQQRRWLRHRRDSQEARVTGTDPSEQLIVALHSHVEAMSNIGKAASSPPASRGALGARR